jgi:hypothetical protein
MSTSSSSKWIEKNSFEFQVLSFKNRRPEFALYQGMALQAAEKVGRNQG